MRTREIDGNKLMPCQGVYYRAFRRKISGSSQSDKGALKQGSLFESKKTMEKKEKKSIHERLKINKEIIAKQQGKDSKEKGVELA